MDINAQMAIASLLAIAANRDGSVDSNETVAMVEVLRRRFGLTSLVALDLVTRALDDAAVSVSPTPVFEQLNDRLKAAEKQDVILMLLDVIAADGEKDKQELSLIYETAGALSISDAMLAKVFKRYFKARRKHTPQARE